MGPRSDVQDLVQDLAQYVARPGSRLNAEHLSYLVLVYQSPTHLTNSKWNVTLCKTWKFQKHILTVLVEMGPIGKLRGRPCDLNLCNLFQGQTVQLLYPQHGVTRLQIPLCDKLLD